MGDREDRASDDRPIDGAQPYREDRTRPRAPSTRTATRSVEATRAPSRASGVPRSNARDPPEGRNRSGDRSRERAVATIERETQGRPEGRARARRPSQAIRSGAPRDPTASRDESVEPRPGRASELARRRRLIEPLASELVDRLEHPVPLVPRRTRPPSTRGPRISKRPRTSSAASSVQPRRTRTGERTATAQPAKGVVAPLDGRPRGLLGGVGVAAALEQVEPLRRRSRICVGAIARARAAASSTASGNGRGARTARRVAGAEGDDHRRDRTNSASASATAIGVTRYSTWPWTRQGLAARDDNDESTAGQRADELRRRVDERVELVDEQQHLPFTDMVGSTDPLRRRSGDGAADE